MASAIDPTKPTTGAATTQSVRDNFAAAKSEIEALQAGSVDYIQIRQRVATVVSSLTTGTVVIPRDATIPQITEGSEFLSLTVTPNEAGNKILVDVEIELGINTTGWLIVALFKVGQNNALTTKMEYLTTGSQTTTIKFSYEDTATADPVTYKVRAGASNAGNPLTLNGSSATSFFGGTTQSKLMATEFH